MDFFIKTENATELFSQKGAVVRYKGRTLDELNSVRILWSNGILFSSSKGRARRESPLPFLLRKENVPSDLRNVVLTNQTQPGNKLWGRIDFLVNHCGYRLLDERC